ncbi:MAG: RimK/LysX family protein [Cytophagales bacterium]|nr:RimK/LysX family protein [Cytophagales bacterium]
MITLGRNDRIDLPGLGLENIHAKIDTGAYTSSLHCSSAAEVNGVLEFILLDEEHPEFTGTPFRVKKFKQKEIKNSFGEAELRYVIRTEVKIYGEVIRSDFSLSNRGNLKFPILLGRRILRGRFLIDVSKKDLSFQQKKGESSSSASTLSPS